jgi:ABC-type dipeptide/oligopeptide/nickel transport system permease component
MITFLKFFIKRLAVIPVTLVIITFVLYGVVMLMPKESRIDLYMPNSKSIAPGWQDRTRTKIIDSYHLDDPFPVQYYYWVRSLFEGDWGYSPSLDKTVLPELIRRTPVTLELIFYSLLLQIPLGLLAGVWSARKKDSLADYATRLATFIATSLPEFILALILLSVFYVSLRWFPPERLTINNHLFIQTDAFRLYTGFLTIDGLLNNRPDITLDALRHLLLPVFTLSFAHWGTLSRITRIQVLDEMKKDYVIAAYARGLGEKKVVWQHAFRNALGPVLTSSAVSAATLVTSVYIVEKIFNLKGVSDLVTKFGPMVPDAAAVLGFAVYSTLIVLGLMFTLDILQAIFLPQTKEETLENEFV